MKMDGIFYLTDEHNNRKFVQIDLEKYGQIWEDFYDGLLSETTKGEEAYPLAEIVEALEKDGNLKKYV